jgi:hypothetical protein
MELKNVADIATVVASIATVVASIVAIIALTVGLWQFNKTQRFARENLRLQAKTLQHEREVKAIELFLKFNELQQEATSAAPSKKGDATFWRHNALVAITESVYRLTAGDAGWEETVIWMLQIQRPFLTQNIFNCKTYDPMFVEKIKQVVPELRCA